MILNLIVMLIGKHPPTWTKEAVELFSLLNLGDLKISSTAVFLKKPINWEAPLCLNTGLAAHFLPSWHGTQQLYLKISLGYLQRNNPITYQNSKMLMLSNYQAIPNQAGIKQVEITTITMVKMKSYFYRVCSFFHFTSDTASRQWLKHKMWKRDLHKGESLKTADAGRDKAKRFNKTRFSRLKKSFTR